MPFRSSISQPSVLNYSSYRDFLRDYAAYSKQKSKSWTYGVWARKLGLASKSSLTMILQGKRNPGKDLLERLATSLNMKNEEREYFFRLVDSEKRTADPIARLIFKRGSSAVRHERRRQWLYLVLLDLCRLPDFVEDISWIRNRLLLPVEDIEIKTCLDDLIQSGVLFRTEFGFTRSTDPATQKQVSTSLSEDDILRFHEDGSQASVEALLRVPRAERVFLTSILRVSQSQLSKASEILIKTQRELSLLLESDAGESVYELHLHLFPLTKKP